jgi:hypothetical protein
MICIARASGKNSDMKKSKIIFSALVVTLLGAGISKLLAEETPGDKIQNQADEAKKNLKKSGRKVKKDFRDATGKSSIKKDIQDDAKNLKDEAETKGKKIKRKVK